MSDNKISCILLGGGRGVRMGGNKIFLSLDGAPLFEILAEKFSHIHIFDEIIVCVGVGEKNLFEKIFAPILKNYPISICEDRAEGRGPIEGLSRGLAAMKNEWGFLFACDMPNPNKEVILRMWSERAEHESPDVIAARIDGHVNAVHAFYKKSCLGHVENSIINAALNTPFDLKIKAFYPNVKIKIIEEKIFSPIPNYRSSFDGFNRISDIGYDFNANST